MVPDPDAQAQAIADEIEALADSFAFDKPGRGESIGKGALDLLAGRIQARCTRQVDPRFRAWGPNLEWAKHDKQKIGKPIGVYKDPSPDSMLAMLNITGQRQIEARHCSMTYGTSKAAKLEAQWFTNGSTDPGDGTQRSGAKNQVPRPFYDLDITDRAAVTNYFKGVFDDLVGRTQ
jgi:hypothetical protein